MMPGSSTTPGPSPRDPVRTGPPCLEALDDRRMFAADFNGDGRNDIVWRNPSTGAVVAWFMNGGQLLGTATVATVTDPDWAIAAIADFNNDLKPDLLWRNDETGQNLIWVMNGAALAFTAFAPAVVSTFWSIGGAGDFSGDGETDLLWQNRATDQVVLWRMSDNIVTSAVTIGIDIDPQWRIVGVSDAEGDGDPDVWWQDVSSGEIWRWTMNDEAVAANEEVGDENDPAWVPVWAEDLSGDGRADLLWRHRGTGQNRYWSNIAVGSNTTVALSTLAEQRWRAATQPRPMVRGDFDGDGNADIVFRNAANGQNRVWLVKPTGPVTVTLPSVLGAEWSIGAVGDINGDTRPDLVWLNSQTREIRVWVMNFNVITQTLTLPSLLFLNVKWVLAGAGDFDRNGRDELLWYDTTQRGITAIRYSAQGTFTDIVPLGFQEGTGWATPDVGDLNLDGKDDVIWRNPSNGDSEWWSVADGFEPVQTVMLDLVTSGPWSIAATRDFSGDGETDLLWWNSTTGQIILWRMRGDRLSTSVQLTAEPDLNWRIVG